MRSRCVSRWHYPFAAVQHRALHAIARLLRARTIRSTAMNRACVCSCAGACVRVDSVTRLYRARSSSAKLASLCAIASAVVERVANLGYISLHRRRCRTPRPVPLGAIDLGQQPWLAVLSYVVRLAFETLLVGARVRQTYPPLDGDHFSNRGPVEGYALRNVH